MARKLYYDFLNNPSLSGHDDYTGTPGTPDLSLTRATKKRMADADNYVRELQAGEAAFTGATFNHNLLTNSVFDGAGTGDPGTAPTDWPALVNTGQITDVSDDGSGSNILTILCATERTFFVQSLAVGEGKTYLISATINSNVDSIIYSEIFLLTGQPAGSTTTYLDGNGNTVTVGTYVPSAGERLTIKLVVGDTAGSINVRFGLGAGSNQSGTVAISKPMAEIDATAAKAVGSTYIPTTTAAVSSLTGTSTKGLLIEEARTNICLQSEDQGTTWTINANAAVNTNQTTAPDGSVTADQVIDSAGTGTGVASTYQTFVLSASTTYTASLFCKADQLTWCTLRTVFFADGPGPDNAETYFDLGTGSLGTKAAGHDDYGIEDFGNGWYRCWIVFTTATDVTGGFGVSLADGDLDNTVDLDGTSSIFVWGAQLEAGAFPTSYIPTTTTSVTRNADAVNESTLSWMATDGTGTMYVSAAKKTGGVGNSGRVFTLFDTAAGDDRWEFTTEASNTMQVYIEAGNVAQAGLLTSAFWNDEDTHRIAIGAGTNDLDVYVDGSSEGTDNSITWPLPADMDGGLHVGNKQGTSNFFNGHIAEIAYWDERFDNAILDSLSDGTLLPAQAGGSLALRRNRIMKRRAKARRLGLTRIRRGRPMKY